MTDGSSAQNIVAGTAGSSLPTIHGPAMAQLERLTTAGLRIAVEHGVEVLALGANQQRSCNIRRDLRTSRAMSQVPGVGGRSMARGRSDQVLY